jgi:tripartite-type tricarboxylate transporter receptor subunit TctC
MIRRRMMLATLAATPALAQPVWQPSRPLRIIVPFPAGGSFDVQARLLAEGLAPALGQPVVVENRPGAGGTIGAAEAAHAAPDAHTLLMGSNGTLAANVTLYAGRLPYDAVRDFAPITLVSNQPQVVVVGEAWPAERSFAALLAALRAQGQPTAFGSSGNGSPTQLAGEMFSQALGLPLVHVPYRGQGPALNDLMGGRLGLMFPSVADVLGQLRAGRVFAMAAMSDHRLALLPEVPTLAELGHPGLTSSIWAGLYARAGSPPTAIARLHVEVTRLLEAPALRARLEAQGFEVLPGTPDALAARQAADTARLGEVIRASGATAD